MRPSVNAPTRPPPPVEVASAAAVVEPESPLLRKRKVSMAEPNEDTRHEGVVDVVLNWRETHPSTDIEKTRIRRGERSEE